MIVFKIDDVLKQKNKSRYWLSKETGISEGNLGKIAKNKTTQIKLETLERICISLECDLSDIMELKR